MNRKINTIVRVGLRGGLIGWFTVDPRKKLEYVVDLYNKEGWNLHQIVPHKSRNGFIEIVRWLVLLCTLLLYTFEDGYILVFEKENYPQSVHKQC